MNKMAAGRSRVLPLSEHTQFIPDTAVTQVRHLEPDFKLIGKSH